MQTVLLVIHLIVALALIGAVLLQRSEGGALGIGSGGGGAGNLFSARGVGNALTRTTAILAVCFFITSIGLTLIAVRGSGSGGSLFDGVAPATDGAPATEGTGGSVLPQLPAAPATPQVPVSQ
ncbi:MAG TPA: preprotein translocase subunit SecG [Aestuariivirga sp.]|jgi:preprotein translocase subunit SecG|nr:preprotein translocase subunit SecG [Hyphomicrobiales bacterium]MBP9173983.1 preprotein translocase subunit SecG [Hyphomicrobiales bacterium]MCC7480972.1 preprotein translocase subunit SecG [Hyphomicrobiales bacterium]HQY72140.1 preprotein translocase subunit SecG [Aestuariivirga sp.]HRA93831.1 preprotein translocase subunit SecG [Aestuariivirga sp.]